MIMTMQSLMTQFYQDIDKFMLEKLVETLYTMKYIDIQYEGKEKIIKYIGEQI